MSFVSGVRTRIGAIPVLGPALRAMRRQALRLRFPGSRSYWEARYRRGGTSGAGSCGELAEFKADYLNRLVMREHVASVIEFGCGDGRQLALARYPSYLGIDVSDAAVGACRRRFADDPTKRFLRLGDYRGECADLSLSLDVIYHLVEDAVFLAYMSRLFRAAGRYVVVYSSDGEDTANVRVAGRPAPHVRHRRFSAWVREHEPAWRLVERVPNRFPEQSFSDFFLFARAPVPPDS